MAVSYFCGNFPMNTTAAPVPVTTGTGTKTLLQIATPPSARGLNVIEWGISFDASVAATPIRCELIDTNVAATVTAHVAAGVQPFTKDSGGNVSSVQLGTALTGYTATAEGAVTATRMGDIQLVAPTGGYVKQFPLGERFEIGPARFLRVRTTAVNAVGALCYVVFSEG